MSPVLRRIVLSCLLCLGVFTHAGAASQCRSVTIRLRLRGERALAAVTLYGKPAVMVLDTGARQTTLLSDAPARLGLRMDPARPAVQGTSYGAPIQLNYVVVSRIGFAGRRSDCDEALQLNRQNDGARWGSRTALGKPSAVTTRVITQRVASLDRDRVNLPGHLRDGSQAAAEERQSAE